MKIGIDVGGTKISGILFDEQDQVIHYLRYPTPAGQYQQTINTIVQIVAELKQAVGSVSSANLFRIGIGTPGSESPATGLMRNCNSTCLNGQPLKQDLEQALQQPIQLANDADCLGLSEAYDGVAAGYAVVFAAILGTGVGGSIVVHQQLLQGPNHIAGEWGHNPMPSSHSTEQLIATPRPCYCGHNNCVETWLNGAGLSTLYNQITGDVETAQSVAALYQQGQNHAVQVIDQYADYAASAFANVINILDPDVIVLGGGLSSIENLPNLITKHLPKYVFSDVVNTKILVAKHGDDSGVRGAARL